MLCGSADPREKKNRREWPAAAEIAFSSAVHASMDSAEILQQQAARHFTLRRANKYDHALLVAALERKRETELVLCRQFGNVLNDGVPAAPDVHSL